MKYSWKLLPCCRGDNDLANISIRARHPTSKTIEILAQVFGISSAELMGHPNGKSNGHKPGPPSHIQQLTQRLTKLPRHKQKVVIEMLEGLLPKV